MRKKNNSLSYCQSKNHPWVGVAFGQQLDADFQKKISDGQAQVLLTSCHTAVATDAAGEVRGGDMQRLRGGEPVFFSVPLYSVPLAFHTRLDVVRCRCICICISIPSSCNSSFELCPALAVNPFMLLTSLLVIKKK